MQTHIYLGKKSKETFLCSVDLEVVPGGTYIIDGVPYKLVDKPTFVIGNKDRDDQYHLQHTELIVERIPETPAP